MRYSYFILQPTSKPFLLFSGTLVPPNAVQSMTAMLSQDTSGAASTPFPQQVVPQTLKHSVSTPIIRQVISPGQLHRQVAAPGQLHRQAISPGQLHRQVTTPRQLHRQIITTPGQLHRQGSLVIV